MKKENFTGLGETRKMAHNLIVFEGPDSVGKTTLAEMLTRTMNRRFENEMAMYYAFPGKEPCTLGKLIYDLHHKPGLFSVEHTIPEECRQLLHIVAHIDAIKRRIIPWLEEGKLVILDRYWWSTFVYGKVYGVDEYFLRRIIDIERSVWDAIKPSVVLNVTRAAPFDEKLNGVTWKQLAHEYASLEYYATREVMTRTVCTDGETPEQTLARLIRPEDKTIPEILYSVIGAITA